MCIVNKNGKKTSLIRAMIWTHPPFYPATKMSQNGRVNQNLSEGESNEEYYCIRH